MSPTSQSLTKTKILWEKELGIELNDDLWNSAIGNIRSIISCGQFGLIQLKILQRVNFLKARLSKIFSDVVDKCDRCNGSPCHLIQLCPNLQDSWLGYFDIMFNILGVNIQPCPLIAIFGITKGLATLMDMQKDIRAFYSLVTRRVTSVQSSQRL